MKTIVFALILLAHTVAFSQSTIKVYSLLKSESSHVLLYLNDEAQDAAYYPEAEITDLTPGTYQLRVSFNADTIADVIEKVEVPRNSTVIFRVEEKTAMGKEVGVLGRSLGRVFGTTKKNERKGLVEHYKLVKISEAENK